MAIVEHGRVSPAMVLAAARLGGTPCYLYDAAEIVERCRRVLAMPHAFGLEVRYAMKANSSRALLELIATQGVGLDVSSLNDARRGRLAGVDWSRMMLTTQDVPAGEERAALETMVADGLVYNACSLRQLELIADFARGRGIRLAVRVNPGVGTGETVTRNTGDKYSSFGIHLSELESAKELIGARGLLVDHMHTHVGSGGDPELWRSNIDRLLGLVEQHFPDAQVANLGGGFKEARMPGETAADIQALGAYGRQRFLEFEQRTGRRLRMAVEPGTYLVANAGYLVTRVLDKKWSGPDGFEFLVLDGGMEANSRPVLYGSRHPFYVISQSGELLSSEFDLGHARGEVAPRVVSGRCCESGDSQTLDEQGHVVPRNMAKPEVGDFVVIGGAGAYCASMSLINYNSYLQAPEVMLLEDGTLRVIRRRQTLEQMTANEVASGG
jgi:diaminopimelate decarboxylase